MEINLEKLAFDLDFHPLENLISAALVNGDLLLYRFSSDSAPQKVSEVHAHTESCRAVHFIDDGRAIVMGPSNRLILATDVETSGTIARLEDAHREAINKIINLHQSKIASGNEGGCIKVWDTKRRSCCGTCQAHEDYVSNMTFVPDSMKLLGTSGDENLSVCNLRKETFSEEELLSLVLVKKQMCSLFCSCRFWFLCYFLMHVFVILNWISNWGFISILIWSSIWDGPLASHSPYSTQRHTNFGGPPIRHLSAHSQILRLYIFVLTAQVQENANKFLALEDENTTLHHENRNLFERISDVETTPHPELNECSQQPSRGSSARHVCAKASAPASKDQLCNGTPTWPTTPSPPSPSSLTPS
ncbi:hypothetical protein UlMin_020736 [Ulmus minor]